MSRLKRHPQKLSPIARSAFETLEHGLWHYFRSDTSTDIKFAILHTDQAIELFLKERVRKGGRSIYKLNNTKETINIWEAYKIIEQDFGCKIPEKPNLELLHEERNMIQHKYSNPTPESAAFFIQEAMKFVLRFVKSELGLETSDFISSSYISRIA